MRAPCVLLRILCPPDPQCLNLSYLGLSPHCLCTTTAPTGIGCRQLSLTLVQEVGVASLFGTNWVALSAPNYFPWVFFPKWCYRSLFIRHDRMFYDIDQKARNCVTASKGIEPRHNATHITDPVNEGGLGLHQIYWTYRSRYISLIQSALRSPQQSPPRTGGLPSVPIYGTHYVALLKQLGASTCVNLQQRVVPRGGPQLLDEESSDDRRLLQIQTPNVALSEYSLRYTAYRAVTHT